MTTRIDLLRAHIAAAKDAPVIGIDDCGPWVVRWVKIVSGRKIAFPSYKTSAEGYELAEKAGGLVNLVAPLLAAVGIWETHAPELGDIGVVRLSNRDVPVIFYSGGYATMRGEGPGVRDMRPRSFVKAWTVP